MNAWKLLILRDLVRPTLLQALPDSAYTQLARYVRLLTRWNARMNLTAVRDPRVLVQLHVAECLRCAQLIPERLSSVLDFGSGAGLPGIPIQIARPELAVTLAESQKKKAAFLREAVRELDFPRTTVYSEPVENMPSEQKFDVVALRAVDRMDQALETAGLHLSPSGYCMVMTSEAEAERVQLRLAALRWESDRVPGTKQRVILIGARQ